MAPVSQLESASKVQLEYAEDVEASATMSKDIDIPIPQERVELTEEDVCSTMICDSSTNDGQNKRIRRKTDKVILVILVWVYFLQVGDLTSTMAE